jgi:hypothetical protein
MTACLRTRLAFVLLRATRMLRGDIGGVATAFSLAPTLDVLLPSLMDSAHALIRFRTIVRVAHVNGLTHQRDLTND